MKQRKERSIPPGSRKTPKPDAAFDLWLQRGLHKMFDDVASEPIPEDLLRLIEEDRKKHDDRLDPADPQRPESRPDPEHPQKPSGSAGRQE